MKIFKRNKKAKEQWHRPWQDRAVSRLVSAINKMQAGFVKIMNSLVNQLPVAKRKVVAVVFFLSTGLLCGYLIASGLINDNVYPLLHMKKIYFPKMDGGQPFEKIEIPKQQDAPGKMFERFKDSLSGTSLEQLITDSLIKTSPAIVDITHNPKSAYFLQQNQQSWKR